MLLLATSPTTVPAGTTVVVETTSSACDVAHDVVCGQVYDWTGSTTAADWTSFLLDKPLTILLIVLVAAFANRLARRAIRRMARTVADASTSTRATDLLISSHTAGRAEKRAETMSTVLRSVASVAIFGIATLLILGELGINLAPLIAGAGIAGIALGFGAQSLVKDVLSGFFMIVEDQYGVGDTIDIGEAVGTVERVTLRITTVRDISGTLWHVPNGEILRVGNKSQLWSRALLDIGVAYGTDVDHAFEVIKATADALWRDPEFANVVKDEPEVLGVEDFSPDAVTIRLTIKTEPAAQFRVERALRLRLKAAFDEAGIEIPFPQRTIWLRTEEAQPAPT